MKILSILNVTNPERITCDSGYIFQSLIAPEFLSRGHKFTFVSPVSIEAITSNNFRHLPLDLGRQKYEVRFNFPWSTFENILAEESPDIVWVHQPELASGMRALINSTGKAARIVSYLHYFPYEIHADNSSIIYDPSFDLGGHVSLVTLSFLNGVMASDLAICHSEFARKLLDVGCKKFLLSSQPRVFNIPPPYDPALIPLRSAQFSERRLLVYNHRLYAHYGSKVLVEYLQRGLHGNDHEFVIMDVLGNRNSERRRLNASVDGYRQLLSEIPGVTLDARGNNRSYYRQILAEAKIGYAPFRPGCPWSMSVIDCMAAGLPVIAPNFAFFTEIVPTQCLHNGSYAQVKELTHQLTHDEVFWQECSNASRDAVAHLSPSRIALQLIEAFSDTCGNGHSATPKEDPLASYV